MNNIKLRLIMAAKGVSQVLTRGKGGQLNRNTFLGEGMVLSLPVVKIITSI